MPPRVQNAVIQDQILSPGNPDILGLQERLS